MAVATGTAIAIAAGVAAAGTGATVYSAEKQRSAQKKSQRQQQALIDKQNAEALATRKDQINQQREQLVGGYNTSTTGGKGITGSIGNNFAGQSNQLG